MHSAVPMQVAKIGHVVLSGLLFVLGILLIVDSRFPIEVWRYIAGVLLLLLGAAKITGYLSKDLYRLAFQYDFVYGFILAGLGVIFLARAGMTAELAAAMIGVFVFSDGVIKIQVARHARQFGISVWWLIMAFAVLAVVSGLFVAVYIAGSVLVLTRVLGITLIIETFLSACTVLSSVRVVEYGDSNAGEEKHHSQS